MTNSQAVAGSWAVTIAVVVLMCLGPLGVYDKPRASIQSLQSAGYSKVVLGNHAFMQCAGEDISALYFSAKNADGTKVTGVVCCGIFKACTVRH